MTGAARRALDDALLWSEQEEREAVMMGEFRHEEEIRRRFRAARALLVTKFETAKEAKP